MSAPIYCRTGFMPENPDSPACPWSSLQNELDSWSDSGTRATFWWRDDDAVEQTPQLLRLDELSQQLQLPVSIAAIPSLLQKSLPRYLRDKNNIKILQHGYSHTSHAASGVKNIEIGGNRSTEEIQTTLAKGSALLNDNFGNQFLPVLVPTWNRIESRAYTALVKAGFSGVSSMWARAIACPVENLLQVNAHLDPVNWRGDRGFIGESRSIEYIRDHLHARRTGTKDTAEPTGILSHHLSQDEQVWDFISELMSTLKQHPAVEWLDAGTIWPKA
jgi:hypothetical protein